MKSYRGTFKKKNGDLREMHFAKLSDLPSPFLSTKLKGSDKKSALSEGLEIVWDLDLKDFRVFNWNNVEGLLKEEEINLKF